MVIFDLAFLSSYIEYYYLHHNWHLVTRLTQSSNLSQQKYVIPKQPCKNRVNDHNYLIQIGVCS